MMMRLSASTVTGTTGSKNPFSTSPTRKGQAKRHRPKEATTNQACPTLSDTRTVGLSNLRAVGATVLTKLLAQDLVKQSKHVKFLWSP